MGDRPDVSVIIPTRDSVEDLRRCLASLTAQRGATFEIVVVDQESSDGTREVAEAAGAVVLHAPRPEVYGATTGHSRNIGARAACGTYLLHLDSDMTLPPNVLATAVAACRGGGYHALTLEEIDVANGFWAQCKALERTTYRGSPVLEAARFVIAELFDAVGGYDENIGSAEDWDIHARYAERGSVGRLPEALCHHLGKLSPRAQLRKKFRYGRSASLFLGKHEGGQFWRAMLLAYGRSWRDLVKNPLHALGFIFLRAAEVGAITAGISVSALERRRASLAAEKRQ
jgi:GT2 family glycosyltransferase